MINKLIELGFSKTSKYGQFTNNILTLEFVRSDIDGKLYVLFRDRILLDIEILNVVTKILEEDKL